MEKYNQVKGTKQILSNWQFQKVLKHGQLQNWQYHTNAVVYEKHVIQNSIKLIIKYYYHLNKKVAYSIVYSILNHKVLHTKILSSFTIFIDCSIPDETFFLHIDIVFEQDEMLSFSFLVAFGEPIQNMVNTY